MFSFAKANPVFPVHILCNPSMSLKYLSEKYGINVKEMLKTPHEFKGSKLEYLRKTFYDDIPNIRSLLHNANGKKKSFFHMKNYDLTEAGYGYVSELLKFSQPASKEKNRKNTNEVKSRYEKELESLQRSERMIARNASMTDEQKDKKKQQRSARAKAARGRMTPAQKIAGNARITPEEKALTSNRKSVSAIAAHTNRKRKRKV